jgi:hypothetical protein
MNLRPFEKGGNEEEARVKVRASWLDSAYRPYRLTVELPGWTRFPRSAELGVRRRRHKVAEWPLGFDKLWPHPVDGAVDRGSPDAEQFGEFGLGVVALVVQLEQVLGLIRLQLWLLAVQPTLRLGYLHSFPRAHLDQVGFELSHHR